MEHDPIITVVMPVYNRPDIVTRTLDSIAAQSYRQLRLIVVDNASTDNTREKVLHWIQRRDNNIKATLLDEPERGAAAARNRGLADVKTEWVMFFDSDDEMRPDHMERIAKTIADNPDADLIYFDMTIIDRDGWSHPKSINDNDIMRGHIFHCSLSTQRVAARTDLVRDAGGWNNRCAIWDDWEWGTRLLLHAKKPCKLHGEPTVAVHPSEKSITGTDYASRAGKFEKVLDITEQNLLGEKYTTERIWIDCRRMILAAAYQREGLKKRSHALRSEVLARYKLMPSVKLYAVYLTQRIFAVGASTLSTLFFKKNVKAQEA